MQKNITATIITLNEEKHIKEVIENVQKVCDEVIVVDSNSTDKTVEIAKALGAIVIEQKFLGDGKQKAFCEQFSKNDWLLSIDADERLEEEAIKKIQGLSLNKNTYEAYSFRRKSFIGKKYIRQWYPDRVTRLYDKSRCVYNVDGAHASVQSDNVNDLNVDMLHYSFENFGELVEKAYRYAVEFAHIRHKEGKRASWYDPFIHGLGAMFKGLIVKGGIFGGLHEWHVAFASSYNAYMKYVVMLELQENEYNEK
ncbi:glycosyltransferase family 2 protein [Sulfurimonas sp. MAG313]|nr:glycosyltransferase family 2 protein [Sulfurimonas sp. MAG313]MDF1881092.1 glycosyltransferase family 2 protein [Sulfurimonas sp. MAG313]